MMVQISVGCYNPMSKRILQLFFLAILFISQRLHAKSEVTVWVRAFGEQAGAQICPYLSGLYESLSPDFDLDIILCTNANDLLLGYVEGIKHLPLKIIFADMDSFSKPLNELIVHTSPNKPVLSLSVGVKMKPSFLIDALSWVERNAWVYGWEIIGFGNDGSEPGKGWYNTAALYSPICMHWMKDHPFPKWIDNGMEGELLIDNQSVPIGGNEEVVLMGQIIREKPNAFFVLNTSERLDSTIKTGTGISYEAKIKRKVFVARHYLEQKLHMSPEKLWDHLLLTSQKS